MAAKRTVEQVDEVIQLAKLNSSDLHNVTQSLYFSQNLVDHSEVRLMEVPADLADLILAGESLVIRGDTDDSAVICTKHKTYDIKEAETSNSLLVVDGLQCPDSSSNRSLTSSSRQIKVCRANGVFHTYLELKEIKPRLHKLRPALPLYSGRFSVSEGQSGLSMNKLLDIIQCSEQELLRGLGNLPSLMMPGAEGDQDLRYYMLDSDYHMRVLSLIGNFVVENSWSFDRVPKADTVDTLSSVEPEPVISQVFDMYFEAIEPSGHGHWKVKRDAFCRFYGEYLLQTGNTFAKNEFEDIWQASLPLDDHGEGFRVQWSQLRGLAIIDASRVPNMIKPLAEYSLPDNLADRLSALFRIKEKWTLDDIAPYMEALTTPKLNVNALMTKYARPVTEAGKKLFCSKHGR